MKKLDSLIIALDFDGTVVTHDFPQIGKEIDNCVATLKRLNEAGTKIILSTMRSNSDKGNYLDEAVDWFKNRNIPLWGIQHNPEQHEWTSSPKCYAHMYIGDDALGCPLTYNSELSTRVFADWFRIEDMLFPIETKKVVAKAKKVEQPEDLAEAIKYINPQFDGMEKYFEDKDEDSFAAFCHSQLSGGIGMKIRNHFEFWSDKKTPLYIDLATNHKCTDPDAMSDKIIRGVYNLRTTS